MLFKAQALRMRARDDHDIHDNSEMIPGMMRPAIGESPHLLSKLAHQTELQTGAFTEAWGVDISFLVIRCGRGHVSLCQHALCHG